MNITIRQISAILSGEKEVEKLPDDKLLCFPDNPNATLLRDVPESVLLKIVRLQTLQWFIRKEIPEPNFDQTERDAEIMKCSTADVVIKSLSFRAEYFRDMSLIDMLIIKIVRDALPEEVNVFDSRYCVVQSKKIWRYPAPEGFCDD